MSGSFSTPGYTLDKRADIVGRAFAAKLDCARDSSDEAEILKRMHEKR